MKPIVIYASGNGNAKAVAQYIAYKTDGKAVSVKEDNISLDGFDTVILGSRVYAGKISKRITKFIDENRTKIENMNAGFYLTCIYDGEKGQKQLENIASKTNIRFKAKAFFLKGKELAKTGEKIDGFIKLLE